LKDIVQHRHVLFMFALFGLSQEVKWFLAQQKLNPRELSYPCHVKPSELSLYCCYIITMLFTVCDFDQS